MRTLTFDQWEFDPPDGEEGLEISIAAKEPFLYPNVAAFAGSVEGISGILAAPVPFTENIGPGNVRTYLQRFAGLTLPTPCDWPTHVIINEWNDFDAVMVGPTLFIRYHWSTTS